MKDLVCGMELDERHVQESLVYKEREYYFCSAGCRAEFQRHAEDYAESAQTEDGAKK